MIFSTKVYDILKFFTQITLPILGTLYYIASRMFDIPVVEEVLGVVLAVDVILGGLLYISSSNFEDLTAKGSLVITESAEGRRLFSLEVDGDPEYEMEGKVRAVFEVKKVEMVKDPYEMRKPRRHNAS